MPNTLITLSSFVPIRRILLKGLLGSWIGWGSLRPLWAARMIAVRLWPAQDYTRVTLESDIPLKASPQLVDDPPRLAVDLEGIELLPSLKELVQKLRPDDPNLAGLRVSQYSATHVRLVMDLRHPIQPQIFSLAPVAAYQHRLVFDLYPQTPPDELERLLKDVTPTIQSSISPSSPPPPPPPSSTIITPSSQTSTPIRTTPILPAPTVQRIEDPLGDLLNKKNSTPPTPQNLPSIQSVPRPRPQPTMSRLVIVALDPGHGGEDPGAIGPTGVKEKDIVLAIAMRLREKLHQKTMGHGGRYQVRVFLTRDADYFVPLNTRVDKAQRIGADLFISIHADAFTSPDPQGASVFALSTQGASSTTARWLANKENAADAIGGVNLKNASAHITRTLLDMSTSTQIRDSLALGGAVLGEVGRVGRLHKRRVEQAGFAVLKNPLAPSILVETAFISNPTEEERLQTPEYQDQMAQALQKGIIKYFSSNPPLARSRATL